MRDDEPNQKYETVLSIVNKAIKEARIATIVDLRIIHGTSVAFYGEKTERREVLKGDSADTAVILEVEVIARTTVGSNTLSGETKKKKAGCGR